MNIHKNARLTPLGREPLAHLIEIRMTCTQAASVCGTSAKTATKWRQRFREEGRDGRNAGQSSNEDASAL